MKFKISQYTDYVSNYEFESARKYKNDTMPKTICKYVSLDGGSCLDKKKLCLLKNSQIWFSKFDALNDPFEYKSIYIDYEKLAKEDCKIEKIKKFYEHIKNMFLIASFSKNGFDNMPMWANYSNTHQGYCVEYKVSNASALFPVSYESTRIEVTNIFCNFIGHFWEIVDGEKTVNNPKYQQYLNLLYIFAAMKDKSWEHENEYRMIYPEEIRGSGKEILASEVGMQISYIYLGYKCSEKYKKRIAGIAKKIGVKVDEMYFNDKETDFVLGHKPYSGT